jgi:hypothetical protein
MVKHLGLSHILGCRSLLAIGKERSLERSSLEASGKALMPVVGHVKTHTDGTVTIDVTCQSNVEVLMLALHS